MSLLHRLAILVIASFLIASFLISPASATPQPAPHDVGTSLRDHLQTLDRRLADQLAAAEQRAARAVAPDAAAQRELALLRRHLTQLESQVRRGDFGAQAPWLERLRALDRLALGVARAGELDPESAKLRLESRAALAIGPQAKSPPMADTCETAQPIGLSPVVGSTVGAGADGDASCSDSRLSPDVWYRFTATENGSMLVSSLGSGFDTVVAVFDECPPSFATELVCADNQVGLQAVASFTAEEGEDYYVRLSGFAGAAGDYQLAVTRSGSLGGRVVAAATGLAVEGVEISVEPVSTGPIGFGISDATGSYRVEGLLPGEHTVAAFASGAFADHVVGAGPCPIIGCDTRLGTRFEVGAGSAVEGVDFALAQGGAVVGTVRSQLTGAPIAGATVIVFPADSSPTFAPSQVTDDQGRYRFEGLAAGTYKATALAFDFLGQLYGGTVCLEPIFEGCDLTGARPIVVQLGTTAAGIDFNLHRGGQIAGTVRAAADGAPIPFVVVQAFGEFGFFLGSATTDSAGRYQLGGLPPGTVNVGAQPLGNFIAELYDDLPCPGRPFFGDCFVGAGEPVPVALGATTPGIDFSLDPGATIEGRVVDAATGAPLAFSSAALVRPDGTLGDTTSTDTQGRYRFFGLAPGTYRVGASGPFGYLDEIFDGVPCFSLFLENCSTTGAQPLVVAGGQTLGGIDFSLGRGVRLAGSVRSAADGAPVESHRVAIFDAAGQRVTEAFVDGLGHWEVTGLPGGRYFAVAFSFFSDFENELYSGLPCPALDCDPSTGTPIDVAAEGVVTGIDFALRELGRIAGRVTDAGSGAPLAGILLTVRAENGFTSRVGTSQADGSYVVSGLGPGVYTVTAGEGGAYQPEVYPELGCPVSGCDPSAGQPIQVALGATTGGIDFTLELGSALSGRVLDAFSQRPLDFLTLEVLSEAGDHLAFASTDENGRYVFSQLAAGAYFVRTRAVRHADQVYAGLVCSGDCDPTLGTPIVLHGAGAVRAGINFALVPLAPAGCSTFPSLCLAEGRFEVRARRRDFAGTAAFGDARPLTDDSGYFWFFDPDNVEVVVKVLDACALPEPRFWVFAAGLTNIEVELEVEDTLTGEVKTYQNALGQPFRPILDTEGFATCAPGARAVVTSPQKPLLLKLFGDCESDGLGLCLNDGRFRVEAFFETFEGMSGQGRAVELTVDSGYFWFFDDDNVEVVVKVLDGCTQTEPRFWVFAAGLTNVEVLLRVTDTESGEVKEYRNPLATPFQPVLDTGAFATCP